MINIALIQFPGSNCERETRLAVQRAGMQATEFLWNEPHQKLKKMDGYIIVGGFSYEDRSRAGVIAASDPLMTVLKEQVYLGKPILGICNGAQILVESGLLQGALTDNKRIQQGKVVGTGYYNAWVQIRLSDPHQHNAFTRQFNQNTILRLPVAHAEGRFVIPEKLLSEMQTVFQYCDASGNIVDEFPVNPNGSVNNIAAIANKAGNVMAMMPHPERTKECDLIFQSMREYIVERQSFKNEAIKPFHSSANEWIVDLIITDNQAKTIENTLFLQGLPAKIKRLIHWEIKCDPEELEKIKKSGVLFNDRKEFLLSGNSKPGLLVRAKEDIIGQKKLQLLKEHFNVQGATAIHHGILWQIEAPEHIINDVIHSHILFNPYAHDCYYY